MPDFQPRTLSQILDDMIAFVQTNSDVSDFTEGSVVRSILEAAAIEDDEQYFQMVQILDMFSIFTAKGDKLHRRLADFGIRQEAAKAATGRVKFYNNQLISDRVAVDASVSDTIIYAFDTSSFPTNGYPYTVRLAEGTTRAHDVTVITNDTVTNTFILSVAVSYELTAGDKISLVTGAVANTVNAGIQIIVPATNSSAAKIYTTQEQAVIDAGNYYSNEVIAKAVTPGELSNAAVGKVTQFLGGSPFTGAGVLSVTPMQGGADQETDEALVQRGIEQIQSLSRGTKTAIKSASKGVEDITTGQRVLSANVIEDFVNDEVIVYIDDGSGLVPDYNTYSTTTTSAAVSSSTTLPLVDASMFPTSGYILIEDSGINELVKFTNKVVNSLTLESAVTFPSGSVVSMVDYVAESTESNQRRFRLNNFPVLRNSEIIYIKRPADSYWVPLIRDFDYDINKGTGDFILINAVPANSQLIAIYSYYINLVASVQKVLEGDPDDEANFPGVKAAGIRLSVEPPAIRRIPIRISISAKPGFTEGDLYDSVRTSVEAYISSLRLGDDVIVSRIVDAVHNVDGVYSTKVNEPSVNITILENELPVAFDALGNSLIHIT